MIRDIALTAQASEDFAAGYRRYVLSLAEEPARAVQGYSDLLQPLRQAARLADDQEQRDVALCALIHSSAEQIQRQGEHYAISYDRLADLHHALLSALTPVAKNFKNDQAALANLDQHAGPKARRYGELMRVLTAQPAGPFAGCIFCQSKCRYGFELAPLARDDTLQRDLVGAIQNIQDIDQMWARVADISLDAAKRAINIDDAQRMHAAAVCFASQVGAALKFSGDSQRKLAKNVRDSLAATKGVQQ